ncbi:25S rRNA (adenine2142-N1)-methyltransferase [Recurvomyces mirabilis]|uniref:25S rRNA adenine-N(1) methyltransferase n=1 Tax=Recurvomyces mirabilis TaxID=574656 RepID=A0AAE1C036_9PEZI|nr:25S rRNA (adenine2142-N1)-methyltransferase [Recurvomyces mirabilis]KAK5154688.1 25S rRNA (adenine2142-N1)-methyltransferase [Recurvomyces mirabilis]
MAESKITNGVAKRARLANGRPPTAAKPKTSLSSKQTAKQIRTYHQLNRKLALAQSKGNDAEVYELKKRMEELGGLRIYQLASIQGQANDRGGDSSTVLMEWLKPVAKDMASSSKKVRLLEVGALSTSNACSKSGLFEIQRIDLNSQAEGIVQQNFMQRPSPTHDHEMFDVISLSLVLNFVPDSEARGEMLKRTCQFLVARTLPERLKGIFPALFLVLPASCVTNSRYMNEERLTCMMASLGYVLLQRRLSAKLVYYLWQRRDGPVVKEQDFLKTQVNPGAGRNNFCVVLKRTVAATEKNEYGLQPLAPYEASTFANDPLFLEDPFHGQLASPGQPDDDFAMIDSDVEKTAKLSQLQRQQYPQFASHINSTGNFSSWLPEGFQLTNRDRQQQQYPIKTSLGPSEPALQVPSSSQPSSRKRSYEFDPTNTSTPTFRLPSTPKPSSDHRQYAIDLTNVNTQAPVAKKKKTKRMTTPTNPAAYTPSLPPTPVASPYAQARAYQQQSASISHPPQYIDISATANITNMAQSLTQKLNGQASVTGLLRDLATRVNEQDQTIQVLRHELSHLRQHVDSTFTNFAEQTTKANRALEEKCQEVIDARDEADILREMRSAGGAYGGPKFQAPVKQPSMLHSMMPGSWTGNASQR